MLPCYFSVITSAFTKVVIFSNGERERKGRMLKKKRTIRSQQEVISFLFTDISFDEYCVKSLFGW